MGIFDKAISKVAVSGFIFTLLSSCAPPRIDYFSYSPDHPLAGDTLTILWRVKHATSVTLGSYSASNATLRTPIRVSDSGSLSVSTDDPGYGDYKLYDIEANGFGQASA